MSIARLAAAASILALSTAAQAQDLMLFPAETFGQVVAPRNESMLGDIQLEAQVGAYNNEFISNYGPNSIFARTGRAVGMVQILTNVGHAPCTGFLVEGNKLITNHHCVPGILKNPKMVERGANAIIAVQFHAGFVRDGIDEGVVSFHVNPVPLETSEALDYTVLQVIGDANATFGALELSAVVPQDRNPFWVIGHPMGEAQRISREKCLADTPAVASGRLRHTCDTLPGNSGSPVIDAGLQQVVGLHHAGSRVGTVNYAVPMADILAQSKVLTASVGGAADGDLTALQAEVARLRAERKAEQDAAKATADRLATEKAELDRQARVAAEAERKKLTDQLAALRAERDRLAEAATRKPVVGKPAGAKAAVPDSAQFPGSYWDKPTAVLSGHEDAVYRAVFSPDGDRVATASADRTARVWDAQSGALVSKLSGHEDWVRSAVFSPDGARIVTASWDKTARAWDAQSGALLSTLSGHDNLVFSVAFSADGDRIVTASYDKTARVWDAQSGALLSTLSGHAGVVYSACFSPDGARIVTASKDGTARVWDAQSGALLSTLSGHAGVVYSACFSPDGARIVTASKDGTARVWDAQNGALLSTLSGHAGTVVSAVFSPDGARIVTASVDKTARVWDAATGRVLATLSGHSSTVFSVAFSPDGTRIVTASKDKTARVWGGF
ncbi:trypsin-like peptidase domain-containing protein [Antarctobacter heliothermus]|uniref:WD domain-containing protein, G-beta repeat-containing protein n=1 Tax=Antarctobacter heliothermus TaxID=74033 RepID=A0A239INP0_9RHOB|nr:trypsin-like peptidase domain-containing protein [Antarctobacter heliothermus]SNS94683.1 WD domain-containing protein, G-beta repeat-containing protein [Antarctobacter heliothermus]